MKKNNINSSEINEFESKYKKIVGMTQEIVKDGKTDCEEFVQEIAGSDYGLTFIENLSSAEKFRANYDLLADAFEKRNNDKLINRIERRRKRRRTRRLAMGASIAAAIVMVSFLIFENGRSDKRPILSEKQQEIVIPTLIIRDSCLIPLDAGHNTLVATDFRDQSNDTKSASEQCLVIPKGYTYTVILADGTEVVLNADSEFRYPTNFNDSIRRVFLKGEAYFKVKKGTKPFVVNSYKTDIKVYGTEFNVKAKDSLKIEAVLVEGLIGVTVEHHKEVRMVPNQLFRATGSDDLLTELITVDASHYVQWMEGNFNYDNYSLDDVLKDLGAWYNVEFSNPEMVKGLNITFFSRKEEKVSEVLKVIELISDIKFEKEKGGVYTISKKNNQ